MTPIDYHNQTKIVATIGPACSSKDKLKELILNSVDVFRINFSHSNHEEHKVVIDRIIELNNELNTNVAILGDLQGPKLRIGEVENNGVELLENNILEFTNKKCIGTSSKVYMSYTNFPQDVNINDTVLIDDGKIKLQVTETNKIDTVKARVVHGGILSSRKGVNLPKTKISLPSLTKKDIDDAEFALEQNIDWLALSFVRSVTDIIDLKDFIRKRKKHTRVIAKIEKIEAIEEIDNIIDVTDAIMVARGDLGVELPFHKVPVIQKMIIDKCIKYSKPVIIATQMMESMITNFTPTRAEANDVANAVIDGASALMLSAETSVGKYPTEVIRAMQEIINSTEKDVYNYYRDSDNVANQTFIPDTICSSACRMAQNSNAKAIIVLTYSGYTAFRVSSHRPNADIFVFTPNKFLLRQMSLLWGVRAYNSDQFIVTDDSIIYSKKFLLDNNLIEEGTLVVHVGSIPLNKRGQTNMVKLSVV